MVRCSHCAQVRSETNLFALIVAEARKMSLSGSDSPDLTHYTLMEDHDRLHTQINSGSGRGRDGMLLNPV
jgi:hypothetical protein